MKKLETKTKSAKEQKQTRKRVALNKLIAGAHMRHHKLWIAEFGGKLPTEIQIIAGLAMYYQNHATSDAKRIKNLKHKFAKLFFAALMKNDIQIFEELIQAMADLRRKKVKRDAFIRRLNNDPAFELPIKPTKKETGRLLRIALLELHCDDLVSIQTVKTALGIAAGKWQVLYGADFQLYPDDSKIYAVMKELELGFLRPGDWFVWIHRRKVVRKLGIQPNGTVKKSGMTLEEVLSLKSAILHEFTGFNSVSLEEVLRASGEISP